MKSGQRGLYRKKHKRVSSISAKEQPADLRVIKQNITFAVLIKVVFLALAVPGFATLWMAVFADMGASLLVIFNSMRLFAVKENLHCPTE